MGEAIKKLFSSRKFLVMLAAGVGLLITKIFKVQVDPDTILQFVIVISSYIVGQSIADFGKGAEQVKAISAVTIDPSVSAADTKKAVEEIKSA